MTETKDLNNSFKRLYSDVQIVKSLNHNLQKQLENTERHCWANAQYFRRECVEVIGIPETTEWKDLKHTTCQVFNSFGSDIGEGIIEVCHRLVKSKCTTITFSRRKDWQHLMRIKKGLKDLDTTNLSFPEGTKIYLNNRLCPYYRGLCNEYKK